MIEKNTSIPSQPLVVKLLVIVGFAVALVVVIWLAFEGVTRLPGAFSSLASIAENIQTNKPTKVTPKEDDTKEVPTTVVYIEVNSATSTKEADVEIPESRPQIRPSASATSTIPKYTPTQVTTTVYPKSNPNGFVDLRVSTLGSGILQNGVFARTARYSSSFHNAIQFDIKNIGTKDSDTWTFKTILPSGETYESVMHAPLKPQERVTFTLAFDLERTRENFVEIRNTVYTQNDTNDKNNSSVWTVAVRD